MINLTLNENKIIKVKRGTLIKELTEYANENSRVVGGLVNNDVKGLNYRLLEDASFEFIYITSSLGKSIYEKTLLFLLAASSKEVFKEREISIGHSLGGGMFFEYTDESEITMEDIVVLKEKMIEFVNGDYDINKLKTTKEVMKASINKNIFLTNKGLVEYLNDGVLTLYSLGSAYGYFYGDLLPSTGYLKVFDIIKYDHGAILLGCDRNNPDKLHEFYDDPKLYEEYKSFDKWLNDVGVPDIASLNRKIESGNIEELILVSEARHEYLISKASEKIIENEHKKKLILISGPSSSGKTTTSLRLRTHLIARGVHPVTIAMDDYFVDREHTPTDENGKPLYEDINAVDLKLFNDHLKRLINGEEVMTPIFDFTTGERSKEGRLLKLDEDTPIIVEGIHALNEELTKEIDEDDKFKIYICPFTVMNIDQYNRISDSKIRLLRRIIRDNRTRNKKAIETIKMWEDVEQGGRDNIIPFRKNADYIINSTLLYELPVIKKYAVPILKEITKDDKFYYEAKNLLGFISLFKEIEDESIIPPVSTLREFIGGSIYND